MGKEKTYYACQNCGAQSSKWLGRCPECGKWNTLAEETFTPETEPANEKAWKPVSFSESNPVKLGSVEIKQIERYQTNIQGFDSVLGGGLVPGSLVLISGEPGAGKSTLMLQAAAEISKNKRVLYVSGEESESQISMRGKRLDVASGDLFIYAETDLDKIIKQFKKLTPELLIVDSAQTTYSTRFSSAPGSVTQVRETAAQLLGAAKSSGIPILLVGHVNKEGQIAGPKTMEHIVDAVIMLEGERFQSFRLMRALKNRFGAVSEAAVFEMKNNGLIPVDNPSELFLAERVANTSGSAVTATVEGTRPLLVEVQALLAPVAYGSGRRTSQGFDHNRLALLLAILERRAGLNVMANDVFLNVVGGVKLSDPAVDLAVAMASASSLLDKPLPENAVFIGELGLGGEIRSVSSLQLRVNEVISIGMKDIYLPEKSAREVKTKKNVTVHPYKSVSELVRKLLL